MKKKEEIVTLNHDLKILKSKLALLQANETTMLFLINQNKKLEKENKKISKENQSLTGQLFNYQTKHIAW